MPPELYHKAPAKCSPPERAEFAALVLKGGEVNPKGLQARISRAAQLVFLKQDNKLQGIAAIKRPLDGYRISVSGKSGVALPSAQFPYELGWVFVEPPARGNGYSHALVKCALAPLAHTGLFATSRSDNAPMHRTLCAFGFVAQGKTYRSMRKGHDLKLFVRLANSKPD
ncbi:MAG TPA: GNAT family N-acetyltransferase [Rhizomicrobium sp.]|nr:GNAT family N-acetyltransferase [Rhizomicrobium sp.]